MGVARECVTGFSSSAKAFLSYVWGRGVFRVRQEEAGALGSSRSRVQIDREAEE